MTQLEKARNNKVSPQMRQIAKDEAVTLDFLKGKIAQGRIALFSNIYSRHKKTCAVGEGLTTKVNVNLGTSTDKQDFGDELKKLRVAVKYKADTVMDLSIGGNLKRIRRMIINESPLPVGTVPIYEAAVEAQNKFGSFLKMDAKQILDVIEEQAREGVDFFTIHCGVTQEALSTLKKQRRLMDIVSRGGALLSNWMSYHKKENPLYENFETILKTAWSYDVTLSLGDGLRPGTIFDSTDRPQIKELSILGQLAKQAREYGVQVIIEGPGHIPLQEIKKNVLLEKRLCGYAPFYVLGPLVTDIASGYDHISAAIGGAIAASAGADFLCLVTPAEHLRHPSVEDVLEGLIATRIAAHSADLTKGIKKAFAWDLAISKARLKRNWRRQIELSINPTKAKRYRHSSLPALNDVCTMCGRYCSIKLMEDCFR